VNAVIFLASDAEAADMATQVENRLERKSSTYPMCLVKKDGSQVWMKISASPIVGKSGTVIGSIGVDTDINEEREEGESMRRSLDEKEILLKEVHHRVKNNMQIISSLLSLQLRGLPDSEQMSSLMRDSQMRIQSMALVHEIL
jgi:hypothetical protein